MSRKMIIILIILTFILVAGISPSAKAFVGVSHFLASPRIIAMGGAYVAVADDANAVFLNPAGLGDLTYGDLYTSYGSLPENIKQYYFVGSTSLKDFGGLGLGYYMVGFFDEPVYEKDISTGQFIEVGKATFQNGDLALSYGYRFFDWFLIGVKGHRLFAELSSTDNSLPDFNGEGYGLDLGILLKPFHNFSMGILFENLYATDFIYNDGMHESIPSGMHLGFSYLPTHHNILLAMDLYSSNLEQNTDIDTVSMGGEYTLLKNIKIRLGCQFDKNVDENYEGIGSAGLGINLFKNLQFDYAWKGMKDTSADSHYFSLGYNI